MVELFHEKRGNILPLMQHADDIHIVRLFQIKHQIRKPFNNGKTQTFDIQ